MGSSSAVSVVGRDVGSTKRALCLHDNNLVEASGLMTMAHAVYVRVTACGSSTVVAFARCPGVASLWYQKKQNTPPPSDNLHSTCTQCRFISIAGAYDFVRSFVLLHVTLRFTSYLDRCSAA